MAVAREGSSGSPSIGAYVKAAIVALVANGVLFAILSIAIGMLFIALPGLGLWVWLASAALVITGGAWIGTRVAGLRGLGAYLVVLVIDVGMSALIAAVGIGLFGHSGA